MVVDLKKTPNERYLKELKRNERGKKMKNDQKEPHLDFTLDQPSLKNYSSLCLFCQEMRVPGFCSVIVFFLISNLTESICAHIVNYIKLGLGHTCSSTSFLAEKIQRQWCWHKWQSGGILGQARFKSWDRLRLFSVQNCCQSILTGCQAFFLIKRNSMVHSFSSFFFPVSFHNLTW